jgi:predicted amidohydrolase
MVVKRPQRPRHRDGRPVPSTALARVLTGYQSDRSVSWGKLFPTCLIFVHREQLPMPRRPIDAPLPRRRLLQAGAFGALAAASSTPSVFATDESPSSRASRRPGRELWIASLTLAGITSASREETVRKVLERMEQIAGARPDLICLPEVFPSYYHPAPPRSQRGEPLDGPTITAMAAFARAKRCYVVAPITLQRDGRLYNTAVLLGRDGVVVGTYDKIHPTEGEIKAGIMPGKEAPVFETDFGRIGIQTCFDIGWPDGWQALRDRGAELVVWPSAYPGGFPLRALAWSHRYPIVTSTRTEPAVLIDLDGQVLAQSGTWEPWISVPFCLDRGLFHFDFHLEIVRKLERTYGRDISVRWSHDENGFVLENRVPGKTLSELACEFGLVPLGDYLARAKTAQDRARI